MSESKVDKLFQKILAYLLKKKKVDERQALFFRTEWQKLSSSSKSGDFVFHFFLQNGIDRKILDHIKSKIKKVRKSSSHSVRLPKTENLPFEAIQEKEIPEDETCCYEDPQRAPTIRKNTPGDVFPGKLEISDDRFGNYIILREIAQGGMGIVYEARELKTDRIVALKILRAGPQSKDTDVRRFLRESKVTSALSHPHIVSIYEMGGRTRILLFYDAIYKKGILLKKFFSQISL